MERSVRYFATVLAAVFVAGVAANSAIGQDKGKDKKASAAKSEKGMVQPKVLTENDKLRVFEVQYKPGEENKAVPSSSTRVVRALKGGTLMRTYTDGKTEKVEWKTGQVRLLEGDKAAYTVKNVGKTDIHLYVVLLK